MVRLLCVADLHVSDTTALAGMRPIDRTTQRPMVLEQAARSLAWVRQQCAEHRPDALLIAGDVYPTPRPTPAAETVVVEALADIADDGTPVLVLLGNHDRPNGGGAHALAPLAALRPGMVVVLDGFEPVHLAQFDHDDGATITSSRVFGNAPLATIYPVPYPSRAALVLAAESIAGTQAAQQYETEAIIAAHARAAEQAGCPTVLFGHGTVEGCTWDGWQTVPAADRPISQRDMHRFTAGVWGHVHKRQTFGDVGPAHGYVGALDRHTFGEESNPAGALLYTIDGDACEVTALDNPHALRFVTLAPDELVEHDAQMRAEVDFAGARCVYRVAGEVTEDEHRAIGAQVRSLIAAGVVVANACTVPRTDRARVADMRADLGVDGVLAAVFEARPDLSVHAGHITGAVRALSEEVAA